MLKSFKKKAQSCEMCPILGDNVNSYLSTDNLINAILTDGVVSKLRTTLTKETGCTLTNEDVRIALENDLFQL